MICVYIYRFGKSEIWYYQDMSNLGIVQLVFICEVFLEVVEILKMRKMKLIQFMSYEFGKFKDFIGEGVVFKVKNLILLGIKECYYCFWRLVCMYMMFDEKLGVISIFQGKCQVL